LLFLVIALAQKNYCQSLSWSQNKTKCYRHCFCENVSDGTVINDSCIIKTDSARLLLRRLKKSESPSKSFAFSFRMQTTYSIIDNARRYYEALKGLQIPFR
jgi:hypothetical protein